MISCDGDRSRGDTGSWWGLTSDVSDVYAGMWAAQGTETDTSSQGVTWWHHNADPASQLCVTLRPGAMVVNQSTWLSACADILLSESIKSMTFCIPWKLNLPVIVLTLGVFSFYCCLILCWAPEQSTFFLSRQRGERDGHLMKIKLGMRQIFCQRQCDRTKLCRPYWAWHCVPNLINFFAW